MWQTNNQRRKLCIFHIISTSTVRSCDLPHTRRFPLDNEPFTILMTLIIWDSYDNWDYPRHLLWTINCWRVSLLPTSSPPNPCLVGIFLWEPWTRPIWELKSFTRMLGLTVQLCHFLSKKSRNLATKLNTRQKLSQTTTLCKIKKSMFCCTKNNLFW